MSKKRPIQVNPAVLEQTQSNLESASSLDLGGARKMPTNSIRKEGSKRRSTRKPAAELNESMISAQLLNPADSVSLRERIELLAYTYWEARGCQGGSPEEDWLRAEREILGNVNIAEQ